MLAGVCFCGDRYLVLGLDSQATNRSMPALSCAHGGDIAQWQSIRLQIERSPVQLRLSPSFCPRTAGSEQGE